jgi:hypothetical protein
MIETNQDARPINKPTQGNETMRDWIEEQQQKRADELLMQDFGPGDLVQGIGNFSDVWFEILSVTRYDGIAMPARFSSVWIVKYSKYGKERWTDRIRFGEVRRVAKQSDVDPKHNRIALRGKLVRPFDDDVIWHDNEPKGYSNCPERLHTPQTSAMTLSEVLRSLGWTYRKPDNQSLQGNQVYDDKGNNMGVLQAHECWDKLRQLGLISS